VTRKLIRTSLPRLLVGLLVLSAFMFPFFVSRADASSEDAAASAISEAEEAVGLAYETVLEAENAGAEVSGLLDKLDEAGMLLAEAQVSFRLGDFDEAFSLANLCSGIGESVEDEAYELRVEAYGSRVMVSWLTMAGSLVGVVVVAFGSFWGWRVFRRRYVRRALRIKPEVAKDES
jgi:hypothetical protein